MAGWTKADYDANYRFYVERRMPGGSPHNLEGRQQVKIHYHKLWMQPLLAARWSVLQSVLNIAPTDKVCMVGVGFGWGVDAVIAETDAAVIGIDISQYIADEQQANTEETELRAEVSAVGLDPDTGHGLEVMNFIFDGQPRSNVIVLQEDAKTGQSRTKIRGELGGNPSVVVYEDIIDDDWADQDIIDARNGGNGFGGQQRLIFLYTQTQARTFQNLFDLLNALQGTPSEVISADGQVHLT